jgi:hypothetical protein
MTRTEERLADALAGAASAVREDSLRPLADQSERGLRRWAALPRAALARHRGWTFWLAPVGAAVAVLTVIGLVAGVTPFSGGPPPARPVRDAATATSPPPYYVSIEGNNANLLTVRQTATGRRTDVIRPPSGWHAGRSASFWQSFEPSAVAAAGDRVFVVAYDNPLRRRTGLFRFGLTSTGRVTGFRAIPGGVLPGLVNLAVAVSPDGTQVAVAGTPAPLRQADIPVQPARIVVVSLLTGARRVWQGGMDRPGEQFSIPGVSWTADGTSLVYVAQWCKPRLEYPDTADCYAPGNRFAPDPVSLVREMAVSGGGPLSSGQVLLRGSVRYPRIVQALLTPSGKLVAFVLRGSHPYLVQLTTHGGNQPVVLFDGGLLAGYVTDMGIQSATLVFDGSGRYAFLDVDQASLPLYGWLRRGRLHHLPALSDVFAVAW